MAKTTAPLLSLEARGSIGQTLVFSEWKGRPYAKRWTKPSNPNTTAQQEVRSVFKFLNSIWPYMPAATIGAWALYAKNNQFTNRNGFVKQNAGVLQNQNDLANMVISPAAGGGIAADGVTFTAASQAVDVVLSAPTLPNGWSIANAWAVAIENVDPSSDVVPDIGSGTDAATPWEPDITGLKGSTEYLCGAWFEYTKANGDSAYGVNLTQLVTTLA